ncbi:hypothetical protein Psi01_75190 [Planobispora siamensis]|uniref:Uncharacterized protein n=1 Tax=Planobispora siamensis TaxID=936338 RepID=A0A8J3WMU5_9ACTN|nr:hypothetical protein Psi01_75190 [Planobispora siamensis]
MRKRAVPSGGPPPFPGNRFPPSSLRRPGSLQVALPVRIPSGSRPGPGRDPGGDAVQAPASARVRWATAKAALAAGTPQ